MRLACRQIHQPGHSHRSRATLGIVGLRDGDARVTDVPATDPELERRLASCTTARQRARVIAEYKTEGANDA